MTARNMVYCAEEPAGTPAEEVYIAGLPGGGAASVADGSVTTEKLADGAVTADKLAQGVLPTADTLQGATETGRALAKAGSAEAARAAIGAGTSSFSGSYDDLSDKPAAYALPAATTGALGGVRQAAHVADPAGAAPTAEEFKALRDALVACGVMASA